MGTPIALKIGKLWAQYFAFSGKLLGKFQAIVMKFCTTIILDPRNIPAKFQLNRPKNRELCAPKFGVMQHSVTAAV